MNHHNESDNVLAFDLLYTTNHIQILKAALPFSPKQMQPMLAILIKYMELAYAISCINTPLLSDHLCINETASKADTIANLISSLEQYLTEGERIKLTQIKDMMKNIEQMKEMQKIMEILQPSSTPATSNILASFLAENNDKEKSTIDQTINQIFATLKK